MTSKKISKVEEFSRRFHSARMDPEIEAEINKDVLKALEAERQRELPRRRRSLPPRRGSIAA